jgi:hypothetical protein
VQSFDRTEEAAPGGNEATDDADLTPSSVDSTVASKTASAVAILLHLFGEVTQVQASAVVGIAPSPIIAAHTNISQGARPGGKHA